MSTAERAFLVQPREVCFQPVACRSVHAGEEGSGWARNVANAALGMALRRLDLMPRSLFMITLFRTALRLPAPHLRLRTIRIVHVFRRRRCCERPGKPSHRAGRSRRPNTILRHICAGGNAAVPRFDCVEFIPCPCGRVFELRETVTIDAKVGEDRARSREGETSGDCSTPLAQCLAVMKRSTMGDRAMKAACCRRRRSKSEDSSLRLDLDHSDPARHGRGWSVAGRRERNTQGLGT